MTSLTEQIKAALKAKAIPEKTVFYPKFFKSFPGGYGEGDHFIGVIVPEQRKLAKEVYLHIHHNEISVLLKDSYHEVRLTALFILVYRFQKLKSEEAQKEIVDFYLAHLDYINNWDLVDGSCYAILGSYFFHRDKSIFYELATIEDLLKQRIAMISSLYWIKRGEFEDALKLAEMLLYHNHDLIHKSVGWMLREIGKVDLETELDFLRKFYLTMPRTALRYAIEKFDPDLRKEILKGEW